MEITIRQSNHLKSIAILMMLFLHLFNNLNYEGLFKPLFFVGHIPLVYYLSLFADACVPIFAFVVGYGLYFKYQQSSEAYGFETNKARLKGLYINYWIILAIFVVGLGFLLQKEGYPGSLLKFIGGVTGLTASSYNGAAWFLTIYIFFVLASKKLFQWVDRFPKVIFIGSFLIYLISFYFRIYKHIHFSNEVLQWFLTNIVLFGTTLFQFLLGVFSLKFRWATIVAKIFNKLGYPTLFALLGVVGLIVFHGLVPNFIIAPLTGLGFIFCFVQMRLPAVINKGLDFLTPHTTNIWLTHMLIYLVYFRDFIYSPRYVIPIFLLLIVCCIISSYIINFILNRILKILDK